MSVKNAVRRTDTIVSTIASASNECTQHLRARQALHSLAHTLAGIAIARTDEDFTNADNAFWAIVIRVRSVCSGS